MLKIFWGGSKIRANDLPRRGLKVVAGGGSVANTPGNVGAQIDPDRASQQNDAATPYRGRNFGKIDSGGSR